MRVVHFKLLSHICFRQRLPVFFSTEQRQPFFAQIYLRTTCFSDGIHTLTREHYYIYIFKVTETSSTSRR